MFQTHVWNTLHFTVFLATQVSRIPEVSSAFWSFNSSSASSSSKLLTQVRRFFVFSLLFTALITIVFA